MDIYKRKNQLIDKINNHIEINQISLTAIFRNHINEIEELKSLGINYLTLLEDGQFPIQKSHYQDLIRRAKKHVCDSDVKPDKQTKVTSPKTTSQPWDSLGLEIPTRLIGELEQLGYTPSSTRDLLAKQDISSVRQLRHFVNERKNKQKIY